MKNNIFRIALFTIPIIAFNVLFFLIGGTKHPTSVWVAYAAIHLAWIICLCTPLMFNKQDHPVNSAVLSSLSLTFFTVQMVVGIVIILIAPSSHIWPLVVEVVLFVVFLIALLGNAWGNSATAAEEKERVENRENPMNYAMRVKMLMSKTQDPDLRRKIMACYDHLMRTPLKNSSTVAQFNVELDGVISQLECATPTMEGMSAYLDELQSLISQRDQMLKFNH